MQNTLKTQAEFTRALHAGRGSAILYVQQNGLADVVEVVLDACVHSRVYDQQVNGSIGGWLYRLVKDSAEFPQIRSAVLKQLTTVDADEAWTLQQLFEFSAECALAGNQAATDAIQQRALEIASADNVREKWMGQEAYVAVGGLDAAIELATRYGTRLLDSDVENGEFGSYGTVDLRFEDEQVDAELAIQLPKLAQNNPALQAYLRYCQWGDKPSPKASSPRRNPDENYRRSELDYLFANAGTKRWQFPGRRAMLGRRLTAVELLDVYEHIEATPDIYKKTHFLWVFRIATLPKVEQHILDLAEHDHDPLRKAAIRALSHSGEARIRELALDKLKHPFRGDAEVLGLFIYNYQVDDADAIIAWLEQQTVSEFEMHSLCWSLNDIAKEVDSAETLPLLQWVYDNTPCMNCRHTAIKAYIAQAALPPRLLAECSVDADEDIRAFAEAQAA